MATALSTSTLLSSAFRQRKKKTLQTKVDKKNIYIHTYISTLELAEAKKEWEKTWKSSRWRRGTEGEIRATANILHCVRISRGITRRRSRSVGVASAGSWKSRLEVFEAFRQRIESTCVNTHPHTYLHTYTRTCSPNRSHRKVLRSLCALTEPELDTVLLE